MTPDRIVIAPSAVDAALRSAIIDRARRRGFRRFLVPEGDAAVAREGEEILHQVGRRIEFASPGRERTFVSVEEVADPEGLRRALDAGAREGTVAIAWRGDRVIPLENAIASVRGRISLWVLCRTLDELPAALGALEHGADHIVVPVTGPDEVDLLETALDVPRVPQLEWMELPLRSIRPVGMGDRVLVDTTSILRPEEGLLVGSSAGFLFHVASEAVGSKFTRPRAFRVNAGAAHSYVLMADGSTRYLSELEPGDAVLVVAPRGSPRSVRIGRLKVERRPMVLVEATEGERARTVFLQEAETVRLSAAEGRVATTELSRAHRVMGVHLPAARHLGRAIEETIEER